MFRDPWVFFLLIPLAAGAAAVFFLRKPGKIPSLRVWKPARQTWRTRFWWLAEAFWGLILLTCLYLMAGPQRPPHPDEWPRKGWNLALVLDRSGSMGARLTPEGGQTRFEAVKDVLSEFLVRRPSDGVTLLSFARYPETHTPVTDSPEIIQGFLDLIPLAVEESEAGTAIGDALLLSGARLSEGKREGEDIQGAVILLTDGKNNAGVTPPEEGAQFLASLGLKLYTIGLGGTGYFVQEGLFGSSLAGQTVDLDVEGLRSLARKTGGDYFQADTPEELDRLLKTLEEGEFTRISRQPPPPKPLDLTWGLWILLSLLILAPSLRWLVLRREWK